MAYKVSSGEQQAMKLEGQAENRSRRVWETRSWRCGFIDTSL